MKTLEFVFSSVNSKDCTKSIAVFCLLPEKPGVDPGVMLFSHGWGCNRYQHRDKMEAACDQHNLICVSVEYRQSGYDFDPAGGSGACVPYDVSFYQVFDTLNALRMVLDLFPAVNHRRIYHYGGSQGGHIALLSGIFAPNTFAFIYASCPMTHLDDAKTRESGRTFAPWEKAIRDVKMHAGELRCPIYLEYGTADENVPCATHSEALAADLQKLGKTVAVRRYPGGGHDLRPATDKLTAFNAMVSEHVLLNRENDKSDDFISGSTVVIPCGGRSLRINWREPPESTTLFAWERS